MVGRHAMCLQCIKLPFMQGLSLTDKCRPLKRTTPRSGCTPSPTPCCPRCAAPPRPLPPSSSAFALASLVYILKQAAQLAVMRAESTSSSNTPRYWNSSRPGSHRAQICSSSRTSRPRWPSCDLLWKSSLACIKMFKSELAVYTKPHVTYPVLYGGLLKFQQRMMIACSRH